MNSLIFLNTFKKIQKSFDRSINRKLFESNVEFRSEDITKIRDFWSKQK